MLFCGTTCGQLPIRSADETAAERIGFALRILRTAAFPLDFFRLMCYNISVTDFLVRQSKK